jgi:hypothetical protein
VRAAAQGRLGAPSDAVHALMRRRVRGVWEAAAAGVAAKLACMAVAAHLGAAAVAAVALRIWVVAAAGWHTKTILQLLPERLIRL